MTNTSKQGFHKDPLEWMENEAAEGAEVSQDTTTGSSDGPVISDSTLKLDRELTIQGVGEFHKQLVSLVNQRHELDIDASGVETVDTATLQLLVILLRQAGECGKKFRISDASDPFMDAAGMLGVNGLLHLSGGENPEVVW